MDEKIVEAKFKKNYLAWGLLIIGVMLLIISICSAVNEYNTTTYYESKYSFGVYYGHDTVTAAEYHGSFGNFFLDELVSFICLERLDNWFALIFCVSIIVILVSLFFFWQRSRGKLIITNKRVSGKSSFGKAVDLPLNQISAVALGSFSSICVATSSGRVHFWSISNRDEIHTTLTNLISMVQINSNVQPNNSALGNADELKKYKDLLDSGIITQEEFDAKKKQLLGL